MEQHVYLIIDPSITPPAGEMTMEVWEDGEACPLYPLPDDKQMFFGYVVYDHEIAAGDLIKYKLEPINPNEWALFQFWEAMKFNGKEATILKELWYRNSLKELRKEFKAPQGNTPAKRDQNRRLAWAALILRGKADLSHVKFPEVIGS